MEVLLGMKENGVRTQEWQHHHMWKARKSEQQHDSQVISPRVWEGGVNINLDFRVSKL